MKQIILLSLLTLLTVSCGQTDNKKKSTEAKTNIETTDNISETQKFKMFCAALENQSTAPNYVVVKAKNLNTGEVKEICTEAPFVEGAIYIQTGNFSFQTDCNDYPNRYFEFSADSALWNISFDLYTITELEEYAKTIDVEKIVQQIKEGKLQQKTFGFDVDEFEQHLREGKTTKEAMRMVKKQTLEETHKKQTMFAHIMFNNGIMMTRGCVAGNVCELYIFDETKPRNQPLIIAEE